MKRHQYQPSRLNTPDELSSTGLPDNRAMSADRTRLPSPTTPTGSDFDWFGAGMMAGIEAQADAIAEAVAPGALDRGEPDPEAPELADDGMLSVEDEDDVETTGPEPPFGKAERPTTTTESLPPAIAALLGPELARGLAGVSIIHNDPSLEDTEYRALATGNRIQTAPGEPGSETPEGLALIGHEVGHVIQQLGLVDTPLAQAPTPKKRRKKRKKRTKKKKRSTRRNRPQVRAKQPESKPKSRKAKQVPSRKIQAEPNTNTEASSSIPAATNGRDPIGTIKKTTRKISKRARKRFTRRRDRVVRQWIGEGGTDAYETDAKSLWIQFKRGRERERNTLLESYGSRRRPPSNIHVAKETRRAIKPLEDKLIHRMKGIEKNHGQAWRRKAYRAAVEEGKRTVKGKWWGRTQGFIQGNAQRPKADLDGHEQKARGRYDGFLVAVDKELPTTRALIRAGGTDITLDEVQQQVQLIIDKHEDGLFNAMTEDEQAALDSWKPRQPVHGEPRDSIPGEGDAGAPDRFGVTIPTPEGWGTQLASHRGVPAYSNGPNPAWYSYDAYLEYGLGFQCVEYANRFIDKVHGGGNMKGSGNANAYSGLTIPGLRWVENGTSGELPGDGDIIVFHGGQVGHIAVVSSGGSGGVQIVHQNWGSQGTASMGVSEGGGVYTVQGLSGYRVAGWHTPSDPDAVLADYSQQDHHHDNATSPPAESSEHSTPPGENPFTDTGPSEVISGPSLGDVGFTDDFESGMGTFADALVPSIGDSAAFEVDINIPTSVPSLSATIGLEADIARNNDGYELGAELAIGAEAGMRWLSVALRGLGLMRAWGDSTRECFALLSVATREVLDSAGAPDWFIEFAFDDGQYARTVLNMDDNDRAELGLGVAIGVGVGEGDAEGAAISGLEISSNGRNGLEKDRFNDARFKLNTGDIGPFAVSGEFTRRNKAGNFDAFDWKLDGDFSTPLSGLSFAWKSLFYGSRVLSSLTEIVSGASGYIGDTTGAAKVGETVDILNQTNPFEHLATQAAKKKLLAPDNPDAFIQDAHKNVGLRLTVAGENTATSGGSFEVSVSLVESLDIDLKAGSAGIEAYAEDVDRLLNFEKTW